MEDGIYTRTHIILLFLTLSTAAAVWLAHRSRWARMRHTTMFYLSLLALIGLLNAADYGHLLIYLGWLN